MSQEAKIDISKTHPVNCDCGSNIFEEGYIMRKASQFMTGTGKDELIPVSALVCKSCHKPLMESVPPPARVTIEQEEEEKNNNDEKESGQ